MIVPVICFGVIPTQIFSARVDESHALVAESRTVEGGRLKEGKKARLLHSANCQVRAVNLSKDGSLLVVFANLPHEKRDPPGAYRTWVLGVPSLRVVAEFTLEGGIPTPLWLSSGELRFAGSDVAGKSLTLSFGREGVTSKQYLDSTTETEPGPEFAGSAARVLNDLGLKRAMGQMAPRPFEERHFVSHKGASVVSADGQVIAASCGAADDPFEVEVRLVQWRKNFWVNQKLSDLASMELSLGKEVLCATTGAKPERCFLFSIAGGSLIGEFRAVEADVTP